MAQASRGAAARAPSSGDAPAAPSRWSWLKRGLTLVFFLVLVALLVQFGSAVEWDAVVSAARANAPATLWLVGGLAVASHAWVATYDLIGRHVTGHGLTAPRVCMVGWVSYAFGLSLGAIIGGAGMRLRLYSRMGLSTSDIAQVYALSVVTNWLAYLVLLGASLIWAPIALPADWHIGRQSLTIVGALLPLIALAYVWACAFASRRRWEWRSHAFELPSGRVALIQLLLSSVNWLVLAGILYILLGSRVDYTLVLGVTLLAAVAGVVVHVPAGLGVMEAVFVALLASQMPRNDILAAMLTYRALYYVGPLLVALIAYGIIELRLRRSAPDQPGLRAVEARG